MDEVEFERLEQRLRKSVVGHEPVAPEALFSFMEEVPVRHRPGRRIDAALSRPGIRRGVFAMAAAVAVVFAMAASAILIDIRSSGVGPGGPRASSPAGWSWQRADLSVVHLAYQVAHGFVGTCGVSPDETMCTSPDGLNWTTPADPRIVAVAAGKYFVPDHIVRSGDVYVATSQSDSVSNPSFDPASLPSAGLDLTPTTVLWRSPDGLNWSLVDSPAFSGLTLDTVVDVGSGFVVVAASTPEETGWALTSPDGLTWTRASRLPVQPSITAVGAAGLVVGSTQTGPDEWRTLDGKAWTRLTTPAGLSVGGAYAIPGGGFVGLGMSKGDAGSQLVRSSDGLTWHVEQGDLQGALFGLTPAGGRLFATVAPLPLPATITEGTFSIWQSDDWGLTWQPFLDTSGLQVQGMAYGLGGRLAIYSVDPDGLVSRISWVVTPSGATVASK